MEVLIAWVAKVLIILTWFGMFDEIFGELFQRFPLVILCLSQLDLRLTEQRPVSTSYCFYTTCHYRGISVLFCRQDNHKLTPFPSTTPGYILFTKVRSKTKYSV